MIGIEIRPHILRFRLAIRDSVITVRESGPAIIFDARDGYINGNDITTNHRGIKLDGDNNIVIDNNIRHIADPDVSGVHK